MNQLRIKREFWPDVTKTPHFIVNLTYEGCKVVYDDIYFDDINQTIYQLEVLEKKRKGIVTLHGGPRFNVSIKATLTGGIDIKFSTESSMNFPGKLILEGCFSVSGEYTSSVTNALIKLFRDGKKFFI